MVTFHEFHALRASNAFFENVSDFGVDPGIAYIPVLIMSVNMRTPAAVAATAAHRCPSALNVDMSRRAASMVAIPS